MSINYGTNFEDDFIESINTKKYFNLSENMKQVIKTMFPNVKEENQIVAEKCDPYGKPDIKVTIGDLSHYVSLKTNTAKHIHSEELSIFIKQLTNFNISSKTLDTIRKFHYGDGTLDGTGNIRMTYDELFPTMIKEIKEANEELNEFNEHVVKLVDKFVFIGNNESRPSADFIYHGSLKFGVICSRKQVLKHLRRRNYDFMRNLHIGPIQFHPYARYASFKEKHPYKRDIVNFVWVNFISDLEYISNHYSFYWKKLII